MAKTVLLFFALAATSCTSVTHRGEFSAAEPQTIVKTPSPDEQLLRTLIEDRRTWIDPTAPF